MPVLFRVLLLVAALLPATVFSGAVGAAETHDPFLVRNLVQDIHDANLVQARNQALQVGQREAYQILMQRITAQVDWPKIPKLDDAGIQDLVLDVGIDQEKQGPGRLIATLSVRFKTESVRKLLRGAGIAYAEWRGRPLMVVPLWQAEAGAVYAEGQNPWRDLWKAGTPEGLVALSVPLPNQLGGLNGAALAAATPDQLGGLAARLNTSDVLVVVAAPGKSDNGLLKLDLTITGQGPLASRLSGQRGFGGDVGETQEQLLLRAANELARNLDDEWKAGNLLQYDTQGTLMAMAPLGSLDDWLTLRERLNRATAVRSFDLAALSKTEAALVLHYVGEQGQLETMLMQNGLVLTWEDQHWALRSTGGGRR
jgi:hypothetical protein